MIVDLETSDDGSSVVVLLKDVSGISSYVDISYAYSTYMSPQFQRRTFSGELFSLAATSNMLKVYVSFWDNVKMMKKPSFDTMALDTMKQWSRSEGTDTNMYRTIKVDMSADGKTVFFGTNNAVSICTICAAEASLFTALSSISSYSQPTKWIMTFGLDTGYVMAKDSANIYKVTFITNYYTGANQMFPPMSNTVVSINSIVDMKTSLSGNLLIAVTKMSPYGGSTGGMYVLDTSSSSGWSQVTFSDTSTTGYDFLGLLASSSFSTIVAYDRYFNFYKGTSLSSSLDDLSMSRWNVLSSVGMSEGVVAGNHDLSVILLGTSAQYNTPGALKLYVEGVDTTGMPGFVDTNTANTIILPSTCTWGASSKTSWVGVAVSGEGNVLAALDASTCGSIHISRDLGASWMVIPDSATTSSSGSFPNTGIPGTWSNFAMNKNGTQIAAITDVSTMYNNIQWFQYD